MNIRQLIKYNKKNIFIAKNEAGRLVPDLFPDQKA